MRGVVAGFRALLLDGELLALDEELLDEKLLAVLMRSAVRASLVFRSLSCPFRRPCVPITVVGLPCLGSRRAAGVPAQ